MTRLHRWTSRGYALLVLLCAPAAHAQTKAYVDQARIALRDYAECLVSARDKPLVGDRERPSADSVGVFLATPPLTTQASRAAHNLNTSICVRGRNGEELASLGFAPDLLRGALFRAKLLKLVPRSTRLPAFAPYRADAPWHVPDANRFAILQAVGECVARENPAQAYAAVAAEAGSRAETEAYVALMPSLSRCMPQDGTYTFSRARLEGLMSEALFFLAEGAIRG